jgi:hypothetical protein
MNKTKWKYKSASRRHLVRMSLRSLSCNVSPVVIVPER